MNRGLKAILGAAVADSATTPLHWIYFQEAMDKALAKNPDRIKEPEFFPSPSCPFYGSELRTDLEEANRFQGHYHVGDLSVYGEQLEMMLEYLSKNNGEFVSGQDFADFMADYFKKYTGRLDHPTKMFLENVAAGKKYPECGADDSQVHGCVKVVPLVAKYAGTPELLTIVETAVRAHQNNDTAVAFALAYTRMLETAVLGKKIDQSTFQIALSKEPEAVQNAFFTAKHSMGIDYQDFIGDYSLSLVPKGQEPGPFSKVGGKSCGLPQAAVVSSKLLLDNVTDLKLSKGTFEKVLRANILAGGDNCSRSVLLGGLLGGLDTEIPESWKNQTTSLAKITKLAESILN